MKKKLKLNDVKVKSFVTELNKDKSAAINGGKIPETMYSCLAYVSCHIVDCLDIEPAS